MNQPFLPRRSLLGLGAALAGGAALSGCTSPAAAPAAKPASSAASGAASSAQLGGQVSLLLLGPTQGLTDHVTKTVLPAFKQATGTTVELQTSDWGSAFQKVTTGAASNSLADVLVIGGIWTAPLASKNVLYDLTDRVKAWGDSSQFYPGMLADGVYQGKNYAIPYGADVRAGVYRKDLLDKAGVSALPTTWDEFTDAAKKVKAAGVCKFPISWMQDKSIGLQQTFAILFLQAGGKYWDAAGKPSFNSEAGKKALTYLVKACTDGLADVNQVYSGSGPQPLVSGESAMALYGMAVYANAEENAKAVMPSLVAGPGLKPTTADKPVSVAWVNKLAMAKNTKSPDAAWALIQFLTGKAQGGEFVHLAGNLPTRRDLADLPWLTGMSKQVLATAEYAISQPANPVMMQLGPAVKALLEPAIRGTVSVDDTLKQIDDKVSQLNA